MNETVVMILNEYLGIGPGCPGKFDGKYLLIGALKNALKAAYEAGAESMTPEKPEPDVKKKVHYGDIFEVAQVIPKINKYMKNKSEIEMFQSIKKTIDEYVHNPEFDSVGTAGWYCSFEEMDTTIFCHFTVDAKMAENAIAELEEPV